MGGFICPGKYHACPCGQSARHDTDGWETTGHGRSTAPTLTMLKGALNRCLKQYRAVQNRDNFQVPAMIPKWHFSQGRWERAWRDSNPRPAAQKASGPFF